MGLELGNQGRIFIDGAPSVEEISKFNGAPAVEPIRAYAGLQSADGINASAELAAQRTGAHRWADAQGRRSGHHHRDRLDQRSRGRSIEYMFNGDSAIVSMQYSFLPSWLSFLVDKENARHAGQALFEAVSARIRALPEGQRPKLVVFGESLGSFGGEAPFLSVNNIVARTDGALFSGPTFNNTMWREVDAKPRPGSPEWLPIYQQGYNVRFAARADNLGRPASRGAPRGSCICSTRPTRSPGGIPTCCSPNRTGCANPPVTTGRMTCSGSPIVTFLQVTADMAVAVDVPDGHGHRYVRDVVNAWAADLCSRRGGRRRRRSGCAGW